MTTARQKVLAYLMKNKAVSAREIARALGMSPPNIRHHLSVLVSDGRVELQAVRSREGRGRPEKLYSLSRVVQGDNLPALVSALLPSAGFSVEMHALARRILEPGAFSGLATSKRLSLLVQKLNEMHYQAHWEAGARGPRIVLGRCPYFRVIDEHPQLCLMDSEMLQLALGMELKQNAKIGKNQTVCIFTTHQR